MKIASLADLSKMPELEEEREKLFDSVREAERRFTEKPSFGPEAEHVTQFIERCNSFMKYSELLHESLRKDGAYATGEFMQIFLFP